MNMDSSSLYPVCSAGQLTHAECFEFTVPGDLLDRVGEPAFRIAEAFIVNWHGSYVAYLNSCPHTQVNLSWSPNQFFDIESQYIQCSMHGALFDPSSGVCLRGPCQGQSLTPLATVVNDGMVCIKLSLIKQ